MSQLDKIGTYPFVAEPFHVDFTGHLTIGVLGNQLLNAAGFHSHDRGFGIDRLNQEQHTWVLSRLALEMTDLPMQYEPYTIETWVENVYRLFTDRNFAVLNKDGKPVAYGRSVWAMINTETRKPVDLMAIHNGDIAGYICDKECPIEKPSRIKVSSQEPVAVLPVKYSDMDINGHVNSIRYIEHILDLFPLDTFKEKRVKRFEMAYVAETMAMDTMAYYIDKVDDNNFDVEVRKNQAEVVCRSKVIFDKLN
ncbi:MAG: acyl-[Bacteroidaceae bacterium]|jgi:acyl-ACP thioesterase|nr:acyl-[acyl-carrier-protein] thioesterase [Bacteroidaceae bacterium]